VDADAFSFAAGVLSVNRDLDEVDPGELEEALDRLVTGGAPAPVLDLGGLNYVPSRHVVDIRAAADRCARGGRPLTIRARRNVAMMLERMGLGVVARVKSLQRTRVQGVAA
jgi:anti-anti-sigma regulatory factor